MCVLVCPYVLACVFLLSDHPIIGVDDETEIQCVMCGCGCQASIRAFLLHYIHLLQRKIIVTVILVSKSRELAYVSSDPKPPPLFVSSPREGKEGLLTKTRKRLIDIVRVCFFQTGRSIAHKCARFLALCIR